MSSKLFFTDIENSEVGTDKLTFGTSLTAALSVTTGSIVGVAVPGALLVDATNGVLYRAWNATSNYEVLNSSATSYGTHQLSLTVNAAVTATDGTAPLIGDFVGIFGAGTWSASGNLNVSRRDSSSAGSLNAGLIVAGVNTSVSAQVSTEIFNGSSWLTNANIATSRSGCTGFGSQNAAMCIAGINTGGSTITSSELFNGTQWNAGANTSISRSNIGGAGTQSAGIIAGSNLTPSELFNGTAWSLSGNLNVSRSSPALFGTANASLIVGGLSSAALSSTELFNGSSWIFSSNTSLSSQSAGGAGTQSAGIIAGGTVGGGTTSLTEIFNGSVWSLSGNMGVSRTRTEGCGSQNGTVMAGGLGGTGIVASTEIHTQTTWRRMTAKSYFVTPISGFLSSANVVTIQGTVQNLSFTFPANTYLVMNRNLDFQTAPNASLTISLASVLGGGSNWTLNFGNSVTVSNVCNGMLAIVTASGATQFLAPM